VDPIDCNKPLTGQKATLVEEDEILATVSSNVNRDIRVEKLDNKGATDKGLAYNWTWDPGTYDFYQPRSQALAAADIDGDGKAEAVGVFVNEHDPQLMGYAIKNPEAGEGDLSYNLDPCLAPYCKGDSVDWVAAAAGNLTGAAYGDDDDEVAVAFRNSQKQLEVIMANGASDGGVSLGRSAWISTDHQRTNVSDLAVAVGDLDGNGYDDEVVLAFNDGGGDLQIVVLKYTRSSSAFFPDGFQELGWDYWSDTLRHNAQHISLAVGDFQGDPRDDMAVGFADGNGDLQVMSVIYDPNGATPQDKINSTGYWKDSANYRDDVHGVSLAAGDIDGDGWDEIVTGIMDRMDRMQIITYDAESGTPTPRGFYANSGGNRQNLDYLAVAAGDLDGDGKANVVVSLIDNVDRTEVISLDDNPKCPCKESDNNGLTWRDMYADYSKSVQVAVALGDVDGNNLYADYTGQCQAFDEAHLISMVGRPPYWEEYNPGTDVGYGTSIAGGSSEEDSVTNSYGGSTTFDSSFHFGEFILGPNFTREWDHSVTQSSAHGSSVETEAGWTSPEDGLVTLNDVAYYGYEYRKRDGAGLARVSIPVGTQPDAKLMSIWNSDGGQTMYPESWVPAYRSGWQDQQPIPGWIGESSGFAAGSDAYDIDGNGRPDYLFAWVNAPGKRVHFRVGRDLDATGKAAGWSDTRTMEGYVGARSGGLGAAIAKINNNDQPDVILAWVDDPDGANQVYYRIGWDMDVYGNVKSWSEQKTIPGGIGWSTDGAGLDTADINGNGRPDLVFGWIDDASPGLNQGYYRVGWDLDANGNSSNWWANPQKIEGIFGDHDAGLGLTLDDMDGNSRPELIAAWVRELDGENAWAYAIGENLTGAATATSWTPGQSIPGEVGSSTAGAGLASAELIDDPAGPEWIASWVDNPAGDNAAWLRVGKWQPLYGEVDWFPTDIKAPEPQPEPADYFRMQLYDQWWNVSGKVLWRYDESQKPVFVSVGGGVSKWGVTRTQFKEETTETSESYNYEIGGEAMVLGAGYEGTHTVGFEQGHSYTISWEDGLHMDGSSQGLPWMPGGASPYDKEYKYVPYTYMVTTTSASGVQQATMVLDYFVTCVGHEACRATNATEAAGPAVAPMAGPAVQPGVPVIASPSHPDPEAWYADSTVVFNWAQPAGDPAAVDGYRWYLDHTADTVPSPVSLGLTNTVTYEGLSDGLWVLHLRAKDASGEWSEAAHRAVRVDTRPPQVTISLNPPRPVDNGGWYKTPVTATVTATDPSTSSGQAGSGVQGIEVSADGLAWQPYTAALVFDRASRHTELWARATDGVGHVSEPISVTFAIDLDMPNSYYPGCWEPDGGCAAEVITDTMGNQRLHLAGLLGGSLSGVQGVGIQINDQMWTAANEIVGTRWAYTSTTDLGAGCYSFKIQSRDRAGSVEELRHFGPVVAWQPTAQPDLSGSRLTVTPPQVRPGETVTVTLVVPNSNWQETLASIAVRLPAGLHVLTETIGADGVYDPAAGTIAWPADTVWPGRERRFTFNAQVDAGAPAADLALTLTALGTWPITPDCPADALPGFAALQTTAAVTATLAVNPTLPAGVDVTPPGPLFLTIPSGQVTHSPDVTLSIRPTGAADVQRMYLREWTWDSAAGKWVVAQESGWVPYAATYHWTLSAGDGVKYLGTWGADMAWNISALDQSSLAFTNLVQGSQFLADGERVQYRFRLLRGDQAIFGAATLTGDPDLYVWQPRSGFRPDYAAAGNGPVDAVSFSATEGGLYLVEVKAEGDSRYELLLAGDVGVTAASAAGLAASTPEHPLTVSDPLSAGAVVAPAFPKLYLPIVMRNQ